MSGLIRGKEAKLAWANGEKLVVVFDDGSQGCIHDGFKLDIFSDPSVKFRLKPRTISINGIEVPAPFEPKLGEIFYYVSADHEDGYAWRRMHDDTPKHLISLGAWRTEEEIKQVVAALRSVFEVTL